MDSMTQMVLLSHYKCSALVIIRIKAITVNKQFGSNLGVGLVHTTHS